MFIRKVSVFLHATFHTQTVVLHYKKHMILSDIYDEFSNILHRNYGKIELKDIQRIMYSYQIASGEGFFMSSLKAITDYLKLSPITVIEGNYSAHINNFSDLSHYLKNIDNVFDLTEYREKLSFNFHENEVKTPANAVNSDLYKEFIDITIPHSDYNSYLKKEIDLVNELPEHFFENGNYKYENRPNLLKQDRINLAKSVLFDLMASNQYIVSSKEIKDKEFLWHWLSVFVGNNDIPNIRQYLTNELYDNPNYIFEIDKASNLFKESDFLIYGIFYNEDKYIGTVRKSDFQRLMMISQELGIQLRELK
ncbi:hypothetical protein [Cellulophaga baltica]|uniref:Uncharacterized protein n=1 Tax=Cellulophaga baltica TaxID=76594 RepID=A0A1G7MHQ5_9FLAO|nr:hypothetical protein [Cellulophaga baltica]SDF60679.1 hypothetical protein SAMN04487992_1541 [Cellulophaga baltica]